MQPSLSVYMHDLSYHLNNKKALYIGSWGSGFQEPVKGFLCKQNIYYVYRAVFYEFY